MQCLLAADKVALGNMPPVKYKLCSPDMYLGILAPTKWRKLCEKLQFTREAKKERKMEGKMQIKRDGLVYLMTKVVADRAEITFRAERLLRGTTMSSIPQVKPSDLCIRAWDTHGLLWVNNLEVRFINGTSKENRAKKKGSRRELSQIRFALEFFAKFCDCLSCCFCSRNKLYINLVSQLACFRYF